MSDIVEDVNIAATEPSEVAPEKKTRKRTIPVTKASEDVAVTHHTFGETDEPPKKQQKKAPEVAAKKEQPVVKKEKEQQAQTKKKESESSTDEPSTAGKLSVVPVPFTQVDFSLFTFSGVKSSPKNHAKYVEIGYGDKSELFVTPKLYCGYGFFKNDQSYSLSPSFLGVEPSWKVGTEPSPEMEANAELMDRIRFYEKCMNFDEFLLDIAVQRSTEWFGGRQIPKEKLRAIYRPLATPNVDKLDDEKEYSRTLKLTFPINMKGEPNFRMYQDGVEGDLNPDDYVKTEMKCWAKFGLGFRKITFPNSGKYKFGIQMVVYQMALYKGGGTTKFVKAPNLF